MTMKVGKWTLAALLFVALGMSGLAATAHARSFKDVPGNHWAAESITHLADREIIRGYSDGRFGVNDPINRAEAAAMIIRSLGWGPVAAEDPGYPDVSPAHWAYNEIATMANNGFFAPADKFEPARRVTRAEMAEMIVNTFDLTSVSGFRFADVARDHPSYDAITILAANAIAVGYEDGTFRPNHQVSRAEFAVFLARALNETFRDGWQPGQAPVIYDVEIGGTVMQLDNPMRLKGTWLAPEQFYQSLGFTVERMPGGNVYLTASDGTVIEIRRGEQQTWVGDALVDLRVGHAVIDGTLYIEAGNLLRELKRPMVFYPDERLIRIEAPRITAADIAAASPETIIDAVHDPLPYWQWTKRDHDYLLRIAERGTDNVRGELLQQMARLTDTFFATERERTDIRGMRYYDDHLTGKLDALSRGLEARHLLLHEPERYAYPAIGKSGALGVFTYLDGVTHQYTVADFSFDHYAERKRELLDFIRTDDTLSFERFPGLTIIAAPFTIVEPKPDGTVDAFGGKAVGSHNMLVSGSNLATFIHEFGHNWDAAFGDHDAYLALRGKAGYVPASGNWSARIEENFAEDFVQAFRPEGMTAVHKGDFGQPDEEVLRDFRQWVSSREQAVAGTFRHELTVNGASILPKAIVVKDGLLHIAGTADNVVHIWLCHDETGKETNMEVPSWGEAYERTIFLPEPGIYRFHAGSVSMTIHYEP